MMIWNTPIAHSGNVLDGFVTSQAGSAASVGTRDPRRICPPPSRRKCRF